MRYSSFDLAAGGRKALLFRMETAMTGKKSDLKNELDALKRKAQGSFGLIPPLGSDIFMAPGEVGAPARSGSLQDLVPGESSSCSEGEFYRIRRPAADLWEEAGRILSEYLETLANISFDLDPALRPLSILGAVPAGDVCYLDLETTGLSNTPLFLVGLIYIEGEDLLVDQLFARDYTEEVSILRFLPGLMRRFPVLVTFNGERFDIPFLLERMSYHKIALEIPRSHIDLLPVSRALVGRRSPNHKLQTLERFVLGRKRVGDIAGKLIPGAYHEFVRTRDAGRMADVIHHNRLDLLSMVELVTVYLSGKTMCSE